MKRKFSPIITCLLAMFLAGESHAQQPPSVSFLDEPRVAWEGQIIRPTPSGGSVTELLNVNTPGNLNSPYGLARLAKGDLLIANQQGPQIIRRAADE